MNKAKNAIKFFILVLSFPLLLYAAPPEGSPPPFTNLETQIYEISTQLDGIEVQLGNLESNVASLQSQVTDLDAETAKLTGTLNVEARIDTEACASTPVQCMGHTYVAADDSNHNPVRMFVQVVQNGIPVAGLTLADFSFSNNFVPAGAGAAYICTDAICGSDRFQATSNGLYTIWLDRVNDGGNWKAGTYAGTVIVTSGSDGNGAAIATFTIPSS